MDFSKFNAAVKKQYSKLTEFGELFVVDADKEELYALYLSSYPEGTNPIYKERTEHDCTCCKQFIRNTGLVVSFVNGKLESIWDIEVDEPAYQAVADELAAFVKSKAIKDLFRSDIKKIGNDTTHQQVEGGVLTWNHFAYELPNAFVMKKDAIPTFLGNKRTNKELLERACKEITLEACETVKELIDQNSLYRGAEHLNTVNLAIQVLKEFAKFRTEAGKQDWFWQKSVKLGESSRFKNSVIGTLLADLSEGVELDKAVASFEAKVAPQNYKRPTALITQGMITKAQETIAGLGLEAALHRRYAVTDDLTINNVLFADRTAKKVMAGVFDELSASTKDKVPELSKVQEMGIQEFLEKVLPTTTGLEVMLDNKHTSNLVSIIAPVDKEAGNILKWDNNFSWSYNGEVADSMKERVKAAGGNVEGVLRFSIQWNENGSNRNDLDAHCIEPKGNRIYYINKRGHSSSGTLDVDVIYPDSKQVAVENIVYTDQSRMPEGVYQLIVNNFNDRGGIGFSAQVEFDGIIFEFSEDRRLRQGEMYLVAEVEYTRKGGFKMLSGATGKTQTKEAWGIHTNKWTKVNLLTVSPNHWDDNSSGNKHWFFVLENCKNPDDARGFYNEFIKGELEPHRKVFEVLGSKLKAKYDDNQLSGVGFSSTVPNSLLCRVTGSFNRTIKINF